MDILADFQEEYLICPNTPEDWKKFRTRWDIPHTLGALDGKHITMKKSKKPASEIYNYKGFFFLVLITVVDTDYRFLLVDVGSSDFLMPPWGSKPRSIASKVYMAKGSTFYLI